MAIMYPMKTMEGNLECCTVIANQRKYFNRWDKLILGQQLEHQGPYILYSYFLFCRRVGYVFQKWDYFH